MFPSSVPTHITPSFTSEGAIVRIVPRACFESFSSGRTRVRSSLTVSQLVPPSLVFSKNCVPRYSRCGSCGEKTIGMVQLNRYLLPNETAAGEMSRTCPVVFDNRTTLPPGPALYTTSGSSGSGIVYPLSPGPTGDRKSTRLNSSHGYISYAVFCLKKKKRRFVQFLIKKKKKIYARIR